jgi:DNA-binding transcriptional MerR regulator
VTENVDIHIAFEDDLLELKLDQLVPTKVVRKITHNSTKFKQILSSIREIGIIEPLIVKRQGKSRYILLDGHLRRAALKELGISSVQCILSSDDEAFTYNRYVNRVAAIQEHRMILRAIKRGVSEEKIAKALNADIRSIHNKRNLLRGICPEVSEILKDKILGLHVFSNLRRMKPVRQIEAVTLMKDAGVFTVAYSRALLAATPQDQLVNPDKPKKVSGLSAEQMARMEAEMQSLQREYQLIEESYGTDVLNHTLATTYLRSLLNNKHVVKYLDQNHRDILLEFKNIVGEEVL